MRALVFVCVLLCISLSAALSPTSGLTKKQSAQHHSSSSHKLKHVSIVDLDSPSKYDEWLIPNFAEISSRTALKRGFARMRNKLDDPCKSNPCDKNAKCIATGNTDVKQGPTYTCRCAAGYEGSGAFCEEINACSAIPSPCDQPATCEHAGPGKYRCHCPPNMKVNGNGCDELLDHTVEINQEAAQIAIDGLKNMEDDKESQLEGEGRDEHLSELQDRIKSLIKTRRATLNDLQDQQIDRVERKVSDVEQTTEAIAATEQQQADLISDLKDTLEQQDKATERQMRERAEQILDRAKDQVINAHRENYHFDGSVRSDDSDEAVPTVAQRKERLRIKKEHDEYMASLEKPRLSPVRVIPHTLLYVVSHPETHVIPQYAPMEHTLVNLVPTSSGKYHVKTSSHIDMVPVGVRVQQQQQQTLVAVQQADPNYVVPETRS
jgi:hypothetical protein